MKGQRPEGRGQKSEARGQRSEISRSFAFRLSGFAFPTSAFWLLAAGLWLLMVDRSHSTMADETPAAMPSIRRVFVPADRPHLWPAGDWIPLGTDEFETLVRDAEAQSEPRAAVIDRADYSATLAGNAVSGRGTLHVRRFIDRPVSVPLGPLNFVLTNLRWADNHPATWGLSPNGETMLLVDRPSGELQVEWHAPMQRLAQSQEVRLQLPAAAVSVVNIALPVDRIVRSSSGNVDSSSPAADGLRPWRIHLGQAHECRLSIRAATNLSSTDSRALLVRQEFSGVVRPEGMRMQCDFQLEFLGVPRREVEFAVSPELQVLFVQLADGPALHWRETADVSERRLIVAVPSPELAAHPTLRVQGLVPSALDRKWMLPQLRVTDGVLLDGQFALRVDSPLELASLKLQGCRKVGVADEDAGSEVTYLKQFDPNATVEVLIRPRPFDAACRVTNHLETDERQGTVRADVAWTVRGGETFSTRYRIAEGWDVHDVEMLGGDDANLSDWNVTVEPSRGRILTVSFRSSLAADRPQRLRVLLRRTTHETAETPFQPVLIPLDTDDIEQQQSRQESSSGSTEASAVGDDNDRLRVVAFQLNSVLTWNAGADDRHAAQFQLRVSSGSQPVRFAWLLPEPAKITRVAVNGRAVSPDSDGAVESVELDWRELRYHVPSSRRGPGAGPSSADSVVCELLLEYRQPAASGFGPVERTVVLPRVLPPIERFAWKISGAGRVVLDGDPRGLPQTGDSQSSDWRSRVFGPLGRSQSARVFNPTLRESWIEAWNAWRGDRSDQQVSLAANLNDVVSTGLLDSTADWSFETREVPLEIRLRLWNASHVGLLAWAALFASAACGLLLRLWQSRRIDWLTIGSGLATLTVTLLASPVPASIAGGCVVGLVLAQFLPWSWSHRSAAVKSRSEINVPTGSTQSFVMPQVARIVVGATAVVWSVSAWAQVAVPGRSAASPAANVESRSKPTDSGESHVRDHTPFDVLVPTRSGAQLQLLEKPGMVYVASELHSRLRSLQKTHRAWRQRELPAYLISSARYAGEWDVDGRLSVLAKFVVHVLSSDEAVPVAFRVAGGHLEQQADCHVNGQVHSVLPITSEDCAGFVVALAGVGRGATDETDAGTAEPDVAKSLPSALPIRTDTVELRLHPDIAIQSSVSSTRLTWPAVVDSTVVLHRPLRFQGVEVAGLVVADAAPSNPAVTDQLSMSGWLALPSKLQIRWSEQALRKDNVPAVQARTLCLVDVQPTNLQYHYQLAGKVTSGEVRVLPLRIPRQAIIRQVRVRSTSNSGASERTVPFPAVEVIETGVAPAPAESSGPASWLRPIAMELPRPLPAEFLVEIETILPLPPETADFVIPVADVLTEAPATVAVKSAVPLIAVRAPAELSLNLTAADEESVRQTTGEEFVGAWNDVSKLVTTLELHASTTLRCQSTRPTSVRSGHSTVEIRVGLSRLDWTLTADVETKGAPTFQHQLRLDPRLRIVQVSVTEDSAERLLRWSRTGDTVTLFLSDKTISRQTIRIHAVMPIQVPQEVPLPRVELLNGSLDGPTLTVLHDLRVQVEISQPANMPPDISAAESLPAEKREQLVGVFQIAGISNAVMLHVRLNEGSSIANRDGPATEASASNDLRRMVDATRRRVDRDWSIADTRRMVIVFGVLFPLLAALLLLRRLDCRRWLNQHESAGFALLGGVWWLAWSPSWLGLLIVLASIAQWFLKPSRQTSGERVANEGQLPITM